MKYILLRPQMLCYLFSSCPVPLRNILFIGLAMGEQLPVYACALVLSQLQALCWLHSPFLGAMLIRLHLFGNFREGILFHHYLCPTECKPSRACTCRVTDRWRGEYPTKLQLWVLNWFGFLHAHWLKFLGQSPAVSLEVMTLSSLHSVVFCLFL